MRMTYDGSARGFTLIELMIAMAIIAILMAIALPSYQQYILRSKRADAKSGLLDMAAREERFYTLNNTYVATAAQLGYTAFPVGLGTGSTPDYNLVVVTQTAAGFTLQAVPQGSQVADGCGTYQLDNFGTQTPVADPSGRACW